MRYPTYTADEMGTHDEPATLPCPMCKSAASPAGTAGKGLGSIFGCGYCGHRFMPPTYVAKDEAHWRAGMEERAAAGDLHAARTLAEYDRILAERKAGGK